LSPDGIHVNRAAIEVSQVKEDTDYEGVRAAKDRGLRICE
jgi:hypothetical protein